MPPIQRGSWGSNFLAGVIDRIGMDRQKEEDEIKGARTNALDWLKSIPQTEHNGPIISKLALDILGAKPGKKHWSDAIFATGKSKDDFISNLYGTLRSALPNEMGDGMQQGNTQMRPGASAQVEMFDPSSNQGFTVDSQSNSNMNTGLGQDSMMGQSQPQPQPGKLQFGNPLGKYKTMNDVFEDEGGNSFIIQYDETRGTSRRIPIGNGITTRNERVADINGKVKASVAQQALAKGVMGNVLALAAKDGLTPQQFHGLPLDLQKPYYSAAGAMSAEMNAAKIGGIQAETNKDIAQGNWYTQQSNVTQQTGGLSPNAAMTNFQTNRSAAINFKNDFENFRAQALSALNALRMHDSVPSFQKLTDEWQQEKIRLQQQYDLAFQKANAMATDANKNFGQFLEGGLGTNNKPGDTPFPYIKVRDGAENFNPGQLPGQLQRPSGAQGVYDGTGTGSKAGNIADQGEVLGTVNAPAGAMAGKVGQTTTIAGRKAKITGVDPGDPANGNYGRVYVQWIR